MDKKELISAVQSLIDKNREDIAIYNNMVRDSKASKRHADESKDIEAEYFYHNWLKKEKEYLRIAVRNQKALKQILQELYSEQTFEQYLQQMADVIYERTL